MSRVGLMVICCLLLIHLLIAGVGVIVTYDFGFCMFADVMIGLRCAALTVMDVLDWVLYGYYVYFSF